MRFWEPIASHPDVAPHLLGVTTDQLSMILASDRIVPLAAEHGGFIFAQMDGIGRVFEYHTLFLAEGHGREAHRALKDALCYMLDNGLEVLTTQEVEGGAHPPRSFGFVPAGDFLPCHLGSLRPWLLTRQMWRASPGGKSCH